MGAGGKRDTQAYLDGGWDESLLGSLGEQVYKRTQKETDAARVNRSREMLGSLVQPDEN